MIILPRFYRLTINSFDIAKKLKSNFEKNEFCKEY